MTYPILAGSNTMAIPAVVQLFAGEAPITTNRAQGGTNVNLPQYCVIALVNDLIVRYDPDASDGSEVAAGVLANALNTVDNPGAWAGYYTGGDFNHEALALYAVADAAVAGEDNGGGGTVGTLSAALNAPTETWTLTCTAESAGAGTFSVVGSVSGAKANATVGVAYDNGLIAFTIADGTPDFAEGDVFTIEVHQPTLAQARAVFASMPTIKVSKCI